MVSLTVTKVLAAIVMLVTTFASGIAPNMLINWMQKKTMAGTDEEARKKKRKIELSMSLMLAFGGGVLLATTFLHIIPEVHAMVDEAIENGGYPDIWYPVPEVMICVGIFIIAIVEEVAHVLVGKYHIKKLEKRRQRNATQNSVSTTDTSTCDDARVENQPNPLSTVSLQLETNDIKQEGITNPAFHEDTHASDGHGHSHAPPVESLKDESLAGAVRSLLVIIALAVHCVLEGMAIGLEDENKDVWIVTVSILCHKLVVIFCLGLEMASARVRISLHASYVFIFSVMSPIGIIIGLCVTNALSPDNATSTAVLGLLQGLGAGTLIYVVFFEILEKDRHRNTNGLLKWAVIMFGYGCMAALQLLDKE